MEEVEITSVYKTKGSGGFGSFLGGIDIIPDPSIKNGYKRTTGNRVFISPTNYNDIKGIENANGIIVAISLLTEL